jgi:hypothetical protein
MRVLALCLLGGCGHCAFPDAPSAPDGVLDEVDDCGWWTIDVGQHLVASLPVAGNATTCVIEADPPLDANAAPIFSDFGDGGPHLTFDFISDSAGTNLNVTITCDDGGRWDARVDVQ